MKRRKIQKNQSEECAVQETVRVNKTVNVHLHAKCINVFVVVRLKRHVRGINVYGSLFLLFRILVNEKKLSVY